jgi:hypothetical protein
VRNSQRRLLCFTVFSLVAALCGVTATWAQTATRQLGVSPTVSQAGSARQHGAYHALVIGINNYRYLPKLKTALGDAQAVASTLRNQYGFDTKLLPDATRDQILTALDDYRRTLSEESNLLIYYAGHGYYDRDEDQAYWAPADAEKDTYARWIIAEEITGVARAIPARHVLIVSDSCYSGMLVGRSVSPLVTPREHTEYIEKMLTGKSRYVMSSGGNEPVADEDAPGHASGHSVFANALLEGLSEMNLTEFSADELFSRYIREQVGGRSKQVPEYNPIRDSGHEEGDFVFFRLIPQPPVRSPLPAPAPPTPVAVVPEPSDPRPEPRGLFRAGSGGLMITAPTATKILLNGEVAATMDATGTMFLNDLPARDYKVRFQMGDFLSEESTVSILDGQENYLRWTPHFTAMPTPISMAPMPRESPKVISFDVSVRHGRGSSRGTLTVSNGSIRYNGASSKGSFVADLATVRCDLTRDGFYIRLQNGKEYEFRSESKTSAEAICDTIRKAAVTLAASLSARE